MLHHNNAGGSDSPIKKPRRFGSCVLPDDCGESEDNEEGSALFVVPSPRKKKKKHEV